jgi:trk system potassium uptake protein TrkA
MHIVVIGLGEVGRHLLGVLDGERHDLVAIDSNVEATIYAEDHFDCATLVGYGASHETLTAAEVHRSDLVVAVTDHDEVNLIAALAAQRLGAKHVIARAQGAEWARWDEGIRYGLLGVDVVINPRVLVAQELARIAQSHGASEVIDIAQDRIELALVHLTEQNPHTHTPLTNVTMPRGSLVAGVVRHGDLFVPRGQDVLLPGDRVYLIGRPDAVLDAEDMFSTRRAARRVCIVGGGAIGGALARILLATKTDVLVIEKDRDIAEQLSADLPEATVVHGDGTDIELLEEEEIEAYDLVAAVTGQDEVNLMSALLARKLDIPRTACVVERADYVEIYRQLGIDIALSPRVVASDRILRYARPIQVKSLTSIEGGQAEVLELRPPPDARAVGIPLKELKVPPGVLVASIVTKDDVIVPRGDDVIAAGDTVVVLTTAAARAEMEAIFGCRPRT